MDPDWTKKEAVAAARDKCRQARELLEEARSIFHETDHDIDHANAGEAILYIDEVIT